MLMHTTYSSGWEMNNQKEPGKNSRFFLCLVQEYCLFRHEDEGV